MDREFSYKTITPKKNSNYFGGILKNENKELLVYLLALFTIPLLPLNQLIVGTLVNALLIKSAIDYNTKKVFLLALVPSIAVITGGILFGNLTPQLLLILPAIWISNFTLMFFTRSFHKKAKMDFFKSAILSSTIKTTILFIVSIILFTLNLVPVIFLTMFGIIQFVTAISGAIVVLISKKIKF
ncbi:MAG: hypothetical protein WC821_01835 [archaeon]|jgi:hypothetical protein